MRRSTMVRSSVRLGVSEAVRELNDVLGLRDCSMDQRMNFADQPELFAIFPRTPGCIRFEVKKCLGPCVGGCTVQQYDDRLTLARKFLDGADDGPMEHLRGEMEARASDWSTSAPRVCATSSNDSRRCAGNLAASFRRRDVVVRLQRAGVRGRRPRLPDSPRSRARGGAYAEDVRRGGALLGMIDDVFTPVERITGQIPTHEIDELLLLSSWFRRFPVGARPDECRDGDRRRALAAAS